MDRQDKRKKYCHSGSLTQFFLEPPKKKLNGRSKIIIIFFPVIFLFVFEWFQKKFGQGCITFFLGGQNKFSWQWLYYLHRLTDSMSPVCKIFTELAQLGQFSHRVIMFVCMFVCAIECIFIESSSLGRFSHRVAMSVFLGLSLIGPKVTWSVSTLLLDPPPHFFWFF